MFLAKSTLNLSVLLITLRYVVIGEELGASVNLGAELLLYPVALEVEVGLSLLERFLFESYFALPGLLF